ncbi:MAG: thymidine phosphorylase [Deltaproteobacteria bacterium]|nr:MAG: thymidine phosphorylase [Deltaproteobacteria bacterium]
MKTYELIKKKRDGIELSRDEIGYMINGFVKGDIPDYQMAAFLMTIYFRGMSPRECVELTMAMVDSGVKVDLSGIRGFKVDKHSTGGVGDTTTLVLAPLVAASGGIVAKMTGRELGHTGGTVDKLLSIPDMNVDMPKEKFVEIVNHVHVGLIAQTASLAHADKHLYALRNVTATVDSIPLIASSIMSKKLAGGSDGIVLDIKTGVGAFTQQYEDALKLARTMVDIGEGVGKKVVGLITGMEQPLGKAIGNAIEVQEAIDTLSGKGPADLVDLVAELGANMLLISGVVASRDEGINLVKHNIQTRRGLEKLGELIEAQGGNREVIENPGLLPQPRVKIEVEAACSGYVEKINALDVGLASKILGAGGKTKDEPIDLSIGIYLNKKVGDPVRKGEPVAVLYSDGDKNKINPARERLLNAYIIGPARLDPPRLFYARVSKEGVEELQ